MSDTKRKYFERNSILAVVLAVTVGGGCAVAQGNQVLDGKQTPQVETSVAVGRVIVVSIPDRKLVLMENGAAKRVYPVAVGKSSTPSPAGQYTIVRRVSNPTYSHHGKVVAPGPKNPVGSRWMGLSTKGYGIHGTNEPNSIGKAASHGCIRMGNADLEELFALVQVGDAVEIHAQRDATVTMALGEAAPAPPTTAVSVTPVNQVLVAGNAAAIESRQGQ
jgi:lipoprotein-anchoring transpeptidase ErfK/SrfK